jgi:hypothetical protein
LAALSSTASIRLLTAATPKARVAAAAHVDFDATGGAGFDAGRDSCTEGHSLQFVARLAHLGESTLAPILAEDSPADIFARVAGQTLEKIPPLHIIEVHDLKSFLALPW